MYKQLIVTVILSHQSLAGQSSAQKVLSQVKDIWRFYMNRLYRAAWIAAAFLGGLTVICSVSAALKLTGKKYIEV